MRNVVSLFAGAGGLDLGFKTAGFRILWANEYDKTIWDTYEYNHKNTILDKRSITSVKPEEILDRCNNQTIHGIIGGPPCQSWSLAGALRGIDDARGQLFYDYCRILQGIRPDFFVAENVPGIVSSKNRTEFNKIVKFMENIGYSVSYDILNAKEYGVPQDRKRVIIVGYRTDLNKKFDHSIIQKSGEVATISVIKGLGKPKYASHGKCRNCRIPNHEVLKDSFSSHYMSRNRRKNWTEPSFTIQAGGRHAPLHPNSARMEKVRKDVMRFVPSADGNIFYRRLSVRECARIQTFPDSFVFKYSNIDNGYKMVGNAVPVNLALAVGNAIINDLYGE